MKIGFRKYALNFRYAFRLHKPLLTLRLAATFARILLLRSRPLRYVDLAIGYACNLKCEHCFATALQANGRRTITPLEYRGIVRQAMKLGAVNFSFQGGEPTLYPELGDFIRNSYPDRNLISVTTNGTMLDAQKIRDLRAAGADILTISLDSAEPEEHDRFRGVKGTFEKTMGTINAARACGLNVTLGAVVSRGTVFTKGFIDLVELAHRLQMILFVALAAPIGNWKEREDKLVKGDDMRELSSLKRRYPLLRTDFEANYIAHGCGAVKEILYLTPYGDVLACPFLHVSLGNAFSESLKTIRQRALQNPYFSRYHQACLAAEDHEFMSAFSQSMYREDGSVRTLDSLR